MLQLNPQQMVDLLLKQLDAFVVASRVVSRSMAVCVLPKQREIPFWAQEAGGVHQEDCLLFVDRTAKH